MSASPEYPFEFRSGDRTVPEYQYAQDTAAESSDADDGKQGTPLSSRHPQRPAASDHNAGKRPNRKRKRRRCELYCQQKRKSQKPALKQRLAQLEQGLEAAKRVLEEAAVLPIQHPELFDGKCRPWLSVLLYGPPGTGKTLLAQAVAHEAGDLAFFSISFADLPLMRHGEPEHGIQALFTAARQHKPSIIFIDKVDVLCGSRTGKAGAGRAKLMVQINGVGKDMEGILVIGATNAPWTLDTSACIRFEQRLYIPLPTEQDRAEMFRLHLEGVTCELTWQDYGSLARMTPNYSGADIAAVCREAAHFRRVVQPHTQRQMYNMRSPVARGMSFEAVPDGEYVGPAVTFTDVEEALKYCKTQVTKESLKQFRKFTKRSIRSEWFFVKRLRIYTRNVDVLS